MSSPRRPDLTDEEYLDIEEALATNARGRTFLRMRDQRSRVMAVTEVRKLMREVKDGLQKTAPVEVVAEAAPATGGRDDAHIRILREELREMSSYIHQTRREIAALRPTDTGANRIMAATGELEGIVTATERATSEILTGVERIQALAMQLPKNGEVAPIAEEIQMQVTEVLTACSFQDITGQRTTKVVNTLRYLEQRVNSMMEIWGVDGMTQTAPPPPDIEDRRPDAHLIHGPAADGGPSQADVDALFEQLGKATEPGKKAKTDAGKSEVAKADAAKLEASTTAEAGSDKSSQKASQSQIDAMFNAAQ
jgi:chemotaxis regulatin CheY-phosphate phosphatase CheZ